MLLYVTVQGQSKIQFSSETQGGYEYNYFKSPKQILQNGTLLTEDDLISSSIYQDINLDFDYSKVWEKHRFRASITPRARLFYDNFDDSYWSLVARAKYDYEISRYTKLFSELNFRRMNREGLDGAQDVLINPLGYTNYGANAGVEFQPFTKHTTSVELFYNFRDFDKFGIRDLEFHEFGVQFKTEQKFKPSKRTHRIGVDGYFKKRLYDTFNASDVIPNGKRDWSYIRLNPYYELPISRYFKIKPSFLYYVRIDNLEDRSGFTQLGPELKLRFKNDKTKIISNVSYITRDYKTLNAFDNNGQTGEKIEYQYVNFSLDLEHQISKQFFITTSLYSRVRSTNYTDISARSFRSYRNQYAGIGIKWVF